MSRGHFALHDQHLPKLSHPDGSPVRALVVDDEPILSELMSMGLRTAGWSVAVSADGPEALKLAKDFRPDLLVLMNLLSNAASTRRPAPPW